MERLVGMSHDFMIMIDEYYWETRLVNHLFCISSALECGNDSALSSNQGLRSDCFSPQHRNAAEFWSGIDEIAGIERQRYLVGVIKIIILSLFSAVAKHLYSPISPHQIRPRGVE
jgi:hypothetical protein